ncbi:MAG: hypothetical protein LBP22_15010 [Deltaproteobacteria bacterium]|nr:hypothetical protein [Deltaproteobacteria bacterium]
MKKILDLLRGHKPEPPSGLIRGNFPRGYLLALFIAGAVLALMTAVSHYSEPDRNDSDFFSVDDLIPRAADGEVGGFGTPEYNRLIEEQNESEAAAAEKDGESYVPTPVGGHRNHPKSPDPKPDSKSELSAKPLTAAAQNQKPAETPVAPQPQQRHEAVQHLPEPVPVQSPKTEPDPGRRKAVLDELKSLISRKDNPLSAPVVVLAESKPPVLSQPVIPGVPLIKTGDLLSAAMVLAVNSDIPAPVLAQVSNGPLKGAKLLGQFERRESGAMLTFNRIIPVGAAPLLIDAVAVDPLTSTASVASHVDGHFFRRWGGLLASGFLEGFGTALGSRGSRVYTNGEILIEEQPGKTLADASLEALGQVGRTAGEQFKKGFDRPPTVHIRAGQTLGVLVLSLQKP